MRRFFIGAIALAVALLFCAVNAWAMTAPEFYKLARDRPGINAFAATVQSAVETGHWKSELWNLSNNGAGIKADKQWRACRPFVQIASPESDGKNYFYRVSYFRKYASSDEFLMDYAAKIKRDYPCSAAHADNMWGYFAGLYHGRLGSWATDHRYFEKLVVKSIQLAPQLLGSAWHNKLDSAYVLALERRSLSGWQKQIIEKALRGCDGK